VRVLFNLLDAGVGGGQQVALGVAGELVRRGHSIGVVVPQLGPATDRFSELGARTHTASLVSLRRPGVIHGARIASQYDLVYSHTSVPGEILAGIAAGFARRPHAVHRHIYPHFSPRASLRAFQRGLYQAVVRRARIIAVADHVADAVIRVGIPRNRIEVIPNGVVIPAEPLLPPAGAGPVRIGLLGRLDPQKGADVFVEAARRMGGGAELVLGAPGAHDRYAEELLAAARAANVGIVIPAGSEFLRGLDVVVLPSRYEGHPLVLLEAMALGKPVVATRIPGIREVVESGRTGVLVPPGDADALVATLRSLVEDPEFRASLGARARESVKSRYALADVHDRIVTFLEATARIRGPS
jgi:glycosyltransferase involved in cell wall biosynthesis